MSVNPGDGGSPSPAPAPAPAPSPAPSPSPSPISHSGSCIFITGGATKVSSTVDSACQDCSVSDAEKAIDGDASTTASINENLASPSAGIALRATAQPGIVYPAGAHAGAKMTLPGSTGPGQTAGVTLKTYLGGTLQESHTVVTPNLCSGTCNTAQVPTSQNFETTKPFDAVEVYVYGGNGATIPAKVAEFCSDW